MTGAMQAAFIRCGAAATAAVLLWAAAQVFGILVLCPPHHAWLRQQAGDTGPVEVRGDKVARLGDAIFTCEVPHVSGPIVWHQDLDCYCAPAAMSAEEVGRAIGGSCRLDHLHPTLSDTSGACRFARCPHHLGVD